MVGENEEQAIVPDDVDESTPNEVHVAQFSSETHIGPLPRPEELGQYESVLHGAADRIITMAEKELAQRHDAERTFLELKRLSIQADYGRSNRGLYAGATVALAIVAAGALMTYLGQSEEAAVVVSGTIASVAAIFVYGARARKRENDDDDDLTP